MIDITWKGTGIFALKRGQAPDLVMRAASLVLQAALMEWASGRGKVRSRLADRFGSGAFSKYGFTQRNRGYQNQQRKAMGQPRPYFSPRRANYAKLATGIAKGNAIAALRALQDMSRNAHTATLVQRPGGYLISSSDGSRTTRVKITFPGARVLNKLGAKGEIYRQEFRDLNRGGDLNNILIRADELFTDQLKAQLTRVAPRRITG
jgi:hypothetical protein